MPLTVAMYGLRPTLPANWALSLRRLRFCPAFTVSVAAGVSLLLRVSWALARLVLGPQRRRVTCRTHLPTTAMTTMPMAVTALMAPMVQMVLMAPTAQTDQAMERAMAPAMAPVMEPGMASMAASVMVPMAKSSMMAPILNSKSPILTLKTRVQRL